MQSDKKHINLNVLLVCFVNPQSQPSLAECAALRSSVATDEPLVPQKLIGQYNKM